MFGTQRTSIDGSLDISVYKKLQKLLFGEAETDMTEMLFIFDLEHQAVSYCLFHPTSLCHDG